MVCTYGFILAADVIQARELFAVEFMLNRIFHYVIDVWRPPVSGIGRAKEIHLYIRMRGAESIRMRGAESIRMRILAVGLRIIKVGERGERADRRNGNRGSNGGA